MTELAQAIEFEIGSRDHLAGLLDDAASIDAPEPEPPTPHNVLDSYTYARVRRDGPQDKYELASTVSTTKWLRWREDVRERNRKRFAVLLWAGDQLLKLEADDPLRAQYVAPIANALARFGFRDQLPRGGDTSRVRRFMVNAWGEQ